jgi:hypothetical protein
MKLPALQELANRLIASFGVDPATWPMTEIVRLRRDHGSVRFS